jgi:formyl-CoA transferase
MHEASVSIFHGLKVLDVASFVAAPAAATILADFGADVIKVEPPGSGDPHRQIGRLPNLPKAEQNYAWTLASRSKRGVAIDLSRIEGQQVLHRLVEQADVFITNFPLPVRKRLGIDWMQLAALNPRLVYASLTGYGEVGPEAGRPGFDVHAYWARSGLADLVRLSADTPPASPAFGMGDQPTAVILYGAIVTALYQREKTGKGGLVRTSLVASGVWTNGPSVQAVLCGGTIPRRLPREEARSALTQSYRCRDGRWIILSIVDELRDWPLLVKVLGLPHLLDDMRFATPADRQKNTQALLAMMDAAFADGDAEDWQRSLSASRLTAAVVARTEDALHDAQMLVAGALVRSDHVPASGLEVDSPFHIEGAVKTPPGRAPDLGEHTSDVLRAQGYAAEEIEALRAAGVIE